VSRNLIHSTGQVNWGAELKSERHRDRGNLLDGLVRRF
jgi:hypothetical protein